MGKKKRKVIFQSAPGLDLIRQMKFPESPIKTDVIRTRGGYLALRVRIQVPDQYRIESVKHSYQTKGSVKYITFPENEFDKWIRGSLREQYSRGYTDTSSFYQKEIDEMYQEGVIKKRSLIQYYMKKYKLPKEDALQFVANNYGMDAQTQSVYLSDEFEKRGEEREKTRKRKTAKMM